jgi:hypothetical protein
VACASRVACAPTAGPPPASNGWHPARRAISMATVERREPYPQNPYPNVMYQTLTADKIEQFTPPAGSGAVSAPAPGESSSRLDRRSTQTSTVSKKTEQTRTTPATHCVTTTRLKPAGTTNPPSPCDDPRRAAGSGLRLQTHLNLYGSTRDPASNDRRQRRRSEQSTSYPSEVSSPRQLLHAPPKMTTIRPRCPMGRQPSRNTQDASGPETTTGAS